MVLPPHFNWPAAPAPRARNPLFPADMTMETVDHPAYGMLVQLASRWIVLFYANGDRVPGDLSCQLFHWSMQLHGITQDGGRRSASPLGSQYLSIARRLGCLELLQAAMERGYYNERCAMRWRKNTRHVRDPRARPVPPSLMEDVYHILPLDDE